MDQIIYQSPGARWAPQIVVMLDDEMRVLSVNRSLSGDSFESLSDTTEECVHAQLHPGCDNKCRFDDLLSKAWSSLAVKDSIEWEVDDSRLGRVFRLNLAKTPELKSAGDDERPRHKLLTITDITKYRREYESLVEQQQALIRLLLAQRLESDSAGGQAFDETGDTGNRLMAGYVKTERSLSRQLVLAQEKERKRVASELHDGIAPTIGAVKYRVEDSIAGLREKHPELDLSALDAAVDEIRNLIEEVRRVSTHLSPSMLEDFGVHVALEWLCKEFKVQNREVDVSCEIDINEAETPELVKVAIYRVVQEALTNIGKHAQATRVYARLESTAVGVKLSVSDNGVGFKLRDSERRYDGKSGLGLRSMRERVEATGGTFDVEAAPQKGVEIRAQWDADDAQTTR